MHWNALPQHRSGVRNGRGRVWVQFPTQMEAHPQRKPAALAAASAVVLVGSMFLDWYRLDLPSQVGGRKINVPTYNAFEGLERADIYLVVAAALALIFAGMLWAGVLSNSPAPGLALLVAGLFALALVVYRGTSRPGEVALRRASWTPRSGWAGSSPSWPPR